MGSRGAMASITIRKLPYQEATVSAAILQMTPPLSWPPKPNGPQSHCLHLQRTPFPKDFIQHINLMEPTSRSCCLVGRKAIQHGGGIVDLSWILHWKGRSYAVKIFKCQKVLASHERQGTTICLKSFPRLKTLRLKTVETAHLMWEKTDTLPSLKIQRPQLLYQLSIP